VDRGLASEAAPKLIEAGLIGPELFLGQGN